MSDTVTEQEFVRITGTDTGPATWLPGWLPDLDVFPDLSHARAEYMRLRDVWTVAGVRRRSLEAQIEAATEQRKGALRDAILAGEDSPQVDDESEALAGELVEAKEHAQAATSAFLEHINHCIVLVVEHRREWTGAITEFQQGLDDEVQALVDRATEIRQQRGHYSRLEHWIQRTVEGASTPFSHFPYSEIATPPSGDPVEEQARDLELMLKSYAGGIAPDKPGTEEQGRRLEKQVLSAPSQEPVPAGEVELNDLDDGELVDWLMGAGMFDGEPRPSAQLVVSAAEGDADMAARLIKAERAANAEAPRSEVLEPLNEITTNGKAMA